MSSSVQQSVGPTERLCTFAANVEYNDIPDDVIEHAKLMVRDTVGVSLAATKTDPFKRVRSAKRRVLDQDFGDARVPGTTIDSLLGDVALLNGVLAHALDFDDVHSDMGGHPSSPVLSALLPVAEHRNASGEELLRAFIVGTEIEITLANVLNPGHYERGWHPTAVLGTVGAAVAVGALRGYNADRLQHTVGIAASQASGIKANFGTMTKSYHVGRAAKSAIEAADLADERFTSNPDALEADFGGFCDLFQGTPKFDFANHLDQLGDPWKLITPPVGFKPYPCCGSTHGAIDAALAVRETLGGAAFDLVDVESIEIREHPRRLGHTDRSDPQTRLDAKFSVQYCVIAALDDGDIWFDDFEPASIEDSRRRDCLETVAVRECPEEFADEEWGAAVAVELSDGTEESARVSFPKGTADNPMADVELAEKYRRCGRRALPVDRVEESAALLNRLEDLDDITELLDVLTE